MTTRVFDFQRGPSEVVEAVRGRPGSKTRRRIDLRLSIVAALFLVPVAGAAEAPSGWFVTLVTAIALLAVASTVGDHVPWGWATLGAAGLGLAIPRGPYPVIGPALFVTTMLCLTLCVANHGTEHGSARKFPQSGSRERAAQILMGLSGEREVGRVLADELPQEYALINGLTLRRGSGDIDHLVVGPTGVFLLETKTMAGQIVCDADGTWHRRRVGRAGTAYDAYIGDPATQVQRNIFAVRQVLRRRIPDILRNPIWIEGLVVFAHPRTELQTMHSRVPAVLLNETSQRICGHVPRRKLQTNEIDAIIAVLLNEARAARSILARQSAQAVVEIAMALPVVLLLTFVTLGVSRVVQAHSAVVAIAQEAARAGALAGNPSDAVARMQTRAAIVAGGLGLDPRAVQLEWDLSRFATSPGQVEAEVQYAVDLGDLPLVGGVAPVVHAEHVEWVDPYRSGVQMQVGGSE